MSARTNRNGAVLVIEDYPDHQYYFQTLLEGMGYSVEVVGDKDAAIDAIKSQRFDLILLDIQLPDRNEGLDILDWMRRGDYDHSNTDTKVIVVTIRDDYEAIMLAKEKYRVSHYLVKPITQDILEEACRT